jgi:uncharacterized protein (DUF1684 family)
MNKNFHGIVNYLFVLCVVIQMMIIFSGCSQKPTSDQRLSAPKDPVLQERLAKDEDFKAGANSPIPVQDKPGFRGLSYYPIDQNLKFSAKLNRYPIPKPIRIATNTGEIRSALLYGYFDFQVGAQACRLQVYRTEDALDRGPSLFIPFRDATSGRETYGAGRYLDLMENTSGIYDLDFNRAYNPYCAYNSEYSCPLPPADNTLAAPIRAGERKYHIN